MNGGARISRTDETRRVFFRIERNGRLAAGIDSADITVTVVNPADSASASPVAAETVEKPGVYYFDLPSAFLTVVGEYGAVIEVDSTGPNVRTTFAFPVNVTIRDMDSAVANMIAVETVVVAVPTPAATAFATALTQADHFWTNMQVVVVNVGGTGEAVARNINGYVQADGMIFVDALPFVPVGGDPVIILRQQGRVTEIVASNLPSGDL